MARIQVLGIGCKKSRALKGNLITALEHTGIDAVVEEITEVERIIKFQILSTPALLINGELFYQGVVPEVEELERLLRNYARQSSGLERILVPTDFSSVAANAFRFAQKVAQQQDSQLQVFHAYHPSFDEENPYLKIPQVEIQQKKEEKLKLFTQEHCIPSAEPLTVEGLVETRANIGFPAEEIVRLSREVDLIIMGTYGDGQMMEKVFGSIASQVAQNAQCPVLLVPPEATYRGFRTVLFATDYQGADEKLIYQLVRLIGDMPADIHFVNIEQDTDVVYKVEDVQFEQIVRERLPGLGFNVVSIACSDVREGLNRYAEANQVDLIVMGTEHRHFIQRLFHRSMTRRMVFKTTRPLLVMHYDD